MITYEQFLARLADLYPEAARKLVFADQLTPTLVCAHAVTLPLALKIEAEAIVRAFFKVRGLPDRTRALEALEPPIADPGNTSALMSYDFHVDTAGHLRLIEINTNASLSLIVDALHETHGLKNPFVESFRDDIIAVFRNEYRASFAAERMLAGESQPQTPAISTIAIVDEKPYEQKLFVEFLLYRELFERAGHRVEICDAASLRNAERDHGLLTESGEKIDLVYNRHTDFYFQQPATAALKTAMEKQSACITPHPHEYRLLADKERLLELSRPDALTSLPLSESERQCLATALIRTRESRDFASEAELWAERKRWFFKPKRSFGGKATYRGATMSRTVCHQVYSGDYIAQEFVPAPELTLPESPSESSPKSPMKAGENAQSVLKMKYDLRFYVYRDRIQLACARLYQGQMTNAKTPGGGVTPIIWS